MIQKKFTIFVTNRDQQYVCSDSESILIAMEKVNARCIHVGCRKGGCGICKVKIITGTYKTYRMSKAHINSNDDNAGFALACQVYPTSDLHIESDHFTKLITV